MAYKGIDENGDEYIQYESDEEFMKALGLDPETIEGDYAESFQRYHHTWDQAKLDKRFQM